MALSVRPIAEMPKVHPGAIIALAVTFATPVAAQTSPNSPDPQPLGSTLTVDALSDLPSSASLYPLLDSALPEGIGDRLDTGGLTTGVAGRVGSHGSSWTQTLFQLDRADITDPSGGGVPLLVPGVNAWERVDSATAHMPIDTNAPGLAIVLIPRRPTDTWKREIVLVGSPPGLLAGNANASPPAIARLNAWTHADLLVSGPLIPRRLGLLMTTTWTRASQFERGGPSPIDSSLGSIFANLVFTPSRIDEFRLIGWGNRAAYPFEHRLAFRQPQALTRDRGVHVQAAWDRRPATPVSWRAFASFTARGRTPDLTPSTTIVMDRLRDGPLPDLVTHGNQSDRLWSVGAQVKPTELSLGQGHHAWVAGIEIGGGATRAEPAFAGRIGEMVDGLPARVWDFQGRNTSRWHDTSFALYAGDSVELLPRVTFDAGVRFESITGSAAGAVTGVSWRNWLPRGGVRWEVIPTGHVTSFINFGRYGHRLPLRNLAYGDPNAPMANVYRWRGTALPEPGAAGPIVERFGPGTGGNAAFSQINPQLLRPYMDEITIGVQSRPRPSTLVRLSGLVRREKQLLGVEDVGVPDSTYSILRVPDTGVDLANGPTYQLLPFYNRAPSTFGADRYVLTNPADHETTFVGVDVTGHVGTQHLFLIAGATAGRSEGLSANRGFQAAENDQGVLGEVFVNPNARTFARGRLFTERGYTIKTAGVYRFGKEVTLAVAARYQDGQHFARLVIVPDLNQGAEAVRAFPNGKTRFTFTMTIDMRLQKGFLIGTRHAVAFADGYNILNNANEIEEFPVTGPKSRFTAAVQPPRVIHTGLRLTF